MAVTQPTTFPDSGICSHVNLQPTSKPGSAACSHNFRFCSPTSHFLASVPVIMSGQTIATSTTRLFQDDVVCEVPLTCYSPDDPEFILTYTPKRAPRVRKRLFRHSIWSCQFSCVITQLKWELQNEHRGCAYGPSDTPLGAASLAVW